MGEAKRNAKLRLPTTGAFADLSKQARRQAEKVFRRAAEKAANLSSGNFREALQADIANGMSEADAAEMLKRYEEAEKEGPLTVAKAFAGTVDLYEHGFLRLIFEDGEPYALAPWNPEQDQQVDEDWLIGEEELDPDEILKPGKKPLDVDALGVVDPFARLLGLITRKAWSCDPDNPGITLGNALEIQAELIKRFGSVETALTAMENDAVQFGSIKPEETPSPARP